MRSDLVRLQLPIWLHRVEASHGFEMFGVERTQSCLKANRAFADQDIHDAEAVTKPILGKVCKSTRAIGVGRPVHPESTNTFQ